MKIFGIEFLNVRMLLERWLPMIAILYTILCVVYSGFIFIAIYTCVLIFRFHYVYLLFPLLYTSWTIYDFKTCERGGRRWEWFREWKLWNYIQKYFPVDIVKTSDLSPSKNYIMLYHPHGIMASGVYACFANEGANFKNKFPNITPWELVNNHFFFLPFTREQFLWGGFCSVSRKSIEWLLSKEGTGNALVLTVGGAAEALEAHPGSATLVLKKRKGFIKLALKHGASLVPMFSFGENEIYKQVKNPEGSLIRKFQNKLIKLFGFTIPFYHGRGIFQSSFGLLPLRKPITLVVGKPIDLEMDTEPTEEKINATHKLYMDRLTELFEEHKDNYNPDLQLKFK